MADRAFACNLLGAPLKFKKESHIGPDLELQTTGIEAQLGTPRRLVTGLFGTIPTLTTTTTTTTTTTEFAADGAAVSAQQSGDLVVGLFGFQEAVNLVSFLSAVVLVHLATWTWQFEWP